MWGRVPEPLSPSSPWPRLAACVLLSRLSHPEKCVEQCESSVAFESAVVTWVCAKWLAVPPGGTSSRGDGGQGCSWLSMGRACPAGVSTACTRSMTVAGRSKCCCWMQIPLVDFFFF